MAQLTSIDGSVRLEMRLSYKSFDPFQKDLEWFGYELVFAAMEELDTSRNERRLVEGKINRKEFAELLRGIDDLMARSSALRFEPADLNFCFEWSHETPSVYLVVTWFDLALRPRTLEERFPSAHAGYRFLCDRDALLGFREAFEREFLTDSAPRGLLQ